MIVAATTPAALNVEIFRREEPDREGGVIGGNLDALEEGEK